MCWGRSEVVSPTVLWRTQHACYFARSMRCSACCPVRSFRPDLSVGLVSFPLPAHAGWGQTSDLARIGSAGTSEGSKYCQVSLAFGSGRDNRQCNDPQWRATCRVHQHYRVFLATGHQGHGPDCFPVQAWSRYFLGQYSGFIGDQLARARRDKQQGGAKRVSIANHVRKQELHP